MTFDTTNTWSDGEVLYAADLNQNFTDIEDEVNGPNTFTDIAPIGSVFPWLKSLTNTPTLPSNWVECNGQTLSDTDSVYDGQVIPDLNSAVDTGLKGYFLRGHTSSGVTESSQNLSHDHNLTTHDQSSNSSGTGGQPPAAESTSAGGTDSTSIANSGGSEARPHNYSVVWIMRIK